MEGTQRRLTGRIRVPLPREDTFDLFTPNGERAWVQGWDPWFPVPVRDETEPGTVFVTPAHAHGHATVWVVIDRKRPERISYARVTAGERAGTVTVALAAFDGTATEVEVTYDLTPLTPAADIELQTFADEYETYLQSWQQAIATSVRK